MKTLILLSISLLLGACEVKVSRDTPNPKKITAELVGESESPRLRIWRVEYDGHFYLYTEADGRPGVLMPTSF